ncbi:MAG: TonB-dependent receptor [Nitrospirae bacterium]|nr:TonB-dependent receptor [Nitrospirota bacterium]
MLEPPSGGPEGSGTLAAGPEAPKEKEKAIKIPLTEIIGTAPTALEHIPGSGRVVTQETLFKNHRLTINEALREVPGVNVRDEEGLGIRPNIGIRGLDPTRSRKIHIMEDGVPIMIMPYGDPSAYYFPPVFRFDRLEILKGSGQLLYGPQNIGGVMNMITRMPSATPQGNLEFRGGNLNYFNTHLDYGGTWGNSGYLVDLTHFQSDTPRFTNIRAKVDDVTFKTVHELTNRTSILAKFNYYREDSGVGYQGRTEKQFAEAPRFTPFENDRFDFRRVGVHVAVQHMFTASLTSTTNFFGHYIARDWTRQEQQGLDAAGNALGSSVTGNNINAQSVTVAPANRRFTNEREYWVYGVEPRFHLTHALLGIKSEADFGARYMYEESDRKQLRNLNSGIGVSSSCAGIVSGAGTTATCLGENNRRTTNAYALFFQNRFFLTDQITVTPGFRVEHINFDQVDRLQNNGNGTFGKSFFTEVLPGIGATYAPVKDYTLFAGVHRGMSPPQVSDAVTSAGVALDLDAELSWTYELGLRGSPTKWAGVELTFFQMDFQNQIISQSVAGGVGATLTNAGRTRHKGIEFATKLDLLDMVTGQNRDQDIIFDINYTWVAQAEFKGIRNSSITGSALLPGEKPTVGTAGNRLPYAPRNMLTAGIAYINRPVGFDARLETQCLSDMFGDDRNTVNPTPSGQRGLIQGWCVLNTAANQHVKPINTTFFLTGKNLLDQLYIVDRTRGIYAGLPLMVQVGAKWTF